ncbi:MAG: hypothetical protein IAC08_05855 [Bacteroidetes bacterium]|uniref:Uncharacterized protein n=1 Tax=Candidatus Cryptobacteroides intestinigallinarum TaxID=2840767 RepID=A0A9D9HL85_9BACT|nr:hypothetical protein [Candidatus Cryptobacteroides intestinigallinarum]
MIEDLRSDIRRLIAAYEAIKAENTSLRQKLQESTGMNEDYRKQITELEKKIDSLKLADTMLVTSRDRKEARERIDRMIKAIDKCISLIGSVREDDNEKEHQDQGSGPGI